jgi:Protein of unknown function (DUF2510)
MTADDASGTVTICKGQGLFLRADDAGVLVRNFYGRARRIAWTEISHFADGQYTKEGVTGWQLFIVLRTGNRVRVTSSVLAPADEVVAAVRKAAQPHGVPADLAGVPVKKGQPAVRGFYEDPGGQVGVRYWDGTRWSPLLPPDASRPPTVGWWPYEGTAQKSPASWSALPTAEGRWTYAATRARRWTVVFAATAVVSLLLLAGGLVVELWWDRGTYHRHMSGVAWFMSGGITALFALRAWGERRFFLKLDRAAKGAPDSWF